MLTRIRRKQKEKSNSSKKTMIIGIISLVLLIFLGKKAYYSTNEKLSEKQSNSELSENMGVNATATPYLQVQSLISSEIFYEITLPEGWEKVAEKANTQRSQLIVRYENLNGDYLAVHVNPAGTGFSSDETWESTVNPSKNGILINEKWTPCGNEKSDFCSKGDGKLTIGVKASETIKANNYFFLVGNDKRESSTNIGSYQKILESIVFK